MQVRSKLPCHWQGRTWSRALECTNCPTLNSLLVPHGNRLMKNVPSLTGHSVKTLSFTLIVHSLVQRLHQIHFCFSKPFTVSEHRSGCGLFVNAMVTLQQCTTLTSVFYRFLVLALCAARIQCINTACWRRYLYMSSVNGIPPSISLPLPWFLPFISFPSQPRCCCCSSTCHPRTPSPPARNRGVSTITILE